MNNLVTSPKSLARVAGVLYLLNAILAGFEFGYVLGKVYIPGDPSASAANVAANVGLVRIGLVADLAQAAIIVIVGMMLFQLLKHVGRNLAGAMVILISIASAIMCLNDIFQFAAVLVATDPSYARAFGAAGSQSLILLMLELHHYGFLIAQVFFGLWLFPMGVLAYKSGMFPKALGLALIVGCLCYLAEVIATFLAPGFAASIKTFLNIPPTIAELWMVGYLLVVGVKTDLASPQVKAPIGA